MSTIPDLLGTFFLVLIAYFVGIAVGKSKGRIEMAYEVFSPFFEDGFCNGWIARHNRQPLVDKRIHSKDLQKLMPSLIDLESQHARAQYQTVEQYRQQQIAILNEELAGNP